LSVDVEVLAGGVLAGGALVDAVDWLPGVDLHLPKQVQAMSSKDTGALMESILNDSHPTAALLSLPCDQAAKCASIPTKQKKANRTMIGVLIGSDRQ
jgi:hypothetical protein